MIENCVIALGRYGDIFNALPIAYHLFQSTGLKPAFMVSEHFKDAIDGCSYVVLDVYPGMFHETKLAIERARGRYKKSYICQTFSSDEKNVSQTSDNFCHEAWRRSEYLALWDRLPLVFDQRDKEREQRLIKAVRQTDKPLLLVALNGRSSPYLYKTELWLELCLRWSWAFQLVELSALKATKPYDLLGLMDIAAGMVTIDTMPAHLAQASQVPFILLATDMPTLWHGSPAKGNCQARITYRESRLRREEMHAAIDSWITRKGPALHHVYSDYLPQDPETRRRETLAKQTWMKAYGSSRRWRNVGVRDDQLPRLFQDGTRRLPFIKDIIDFAAYQAGDDDYVVLTNTDTCFVEGMTQSLADKTRTYHAVWAHRRDFAKLSPTLMPRPMEVKQGDYYPGTDLFSMKKSWWLANRTSMPDMILGAEGWDCCLRELMRERGGKEEKDIIAHERHGSRWESSTNRYALPSQKHCIKLAHDFLITRKLDPKRYGIRIDLLK